MLFGGSNNTNFETSVSNGILFNDTWILTVDNPFRLEWKLVTTSKSPPARVYHAMAAFGPLEGSHGKTFRAVMFGGCAKHYCEQLLGDTWVFQGDHEIPFGSSVLVNEEWKMLTGPSPKPRHGHAMAYVY